MNKHLIIKIYGLVQGVLFRTSAKNKAKELGLKGYIQNLEDGSLIIEIEGEEDKLNYFLGWCRDGPPWAKVERIEYDFDNEVKHYRDFIIKK
ncbi:MAG: Acylphosphatase [Parcubacteria group bacterium GW2011_GWE2_39_37]|uniref:acylphosphatase n=1 Tax=Candidatus Falkowbacteria bacterium GW2011_GWF2_39_8 TaxID=1618642 RepID=A0A0G0S9P1_9BACT|nr:MAG: Acylphosphatase [Parcubacteria group bacterium GW2011_GWE2_39_37]KKR31485.1 MAG: Acylphosphatase [Candidatus Falkowbacteria bacterium GW2011_GWF2_39_8]